LFEIEYREEILEEDLPQIPVNLRRRIVRAIESRLGTEPSKYGVRLRRSLQGLWKLRVGDYRVVFELQNERVRVWAIVHRKRVYEEAARRRQKG
jgi:mRNA interferase RelE/StbE